MLLYHGSNTEISGIVLSKCGKYKDFGQGFYLTSLRQQAVDWAKKITKRFGTGMATLNKYDFVHGLVANDDISAILETFLLGILPMAEISQALVYKELNDQYSFHTDKALSHLKFLGSETV